MNPVLSGKKLLPTVYPFNPNRIQICQRSTHAEHVTITLPMVILDATFVHTGLRW